MDRRGQSGGGRRGDEGWRQGGGRGGPWMQQYCLDCFEIARCFADMGGSRSDTPPLCKISGPANKMVRFGTPKRLHFSPGTLNRALKLRIFTYIVDAASMVWLARILCEKNERDQTHQRRDIEEDVLTPQARLSNQVNNMEGPTAAAVDTFFRLWEGGSTPPRKKNVRRGGVCAQSRRRCKNMGGVISSVDTFNHRTHGSQK